MAIWCQRVSVFGGFCGFRLHVDRESSFNAFYVSTRRRICLAPPPGGAGPTATARALREALGRGLPRARPLPRCWRAFASRMHRWPFFCRREGKNGRFGQKTPRVCGKSPFYEGLCANAMIDSFAFARNDRDDAMNDRTGARNDGGGTGGEIWFFVERGTAGSGRVGGKGKAGPGEGSGAYGRTACV